MTYSQFTYSGNFTGLTPAQITSAIGVIESMYYGAINFYWATLPDPPRTTNRVLLENLLVAWYIANTNPSALTGVDANGLPLVSKSIGGTTVAFKDFPVPPGMENLTTNTFGIQALQMMLGAPERFQVFG